MSVGVMGVCVGGTRSTGGVSAADDVRVASVLRGVRDDGGVCICLARGGFGGVGGVWDRWVINPVWIIWGICVCALVVVVWAEWGGESGMGAWRRAFVVR